MPPCDVIFFRERDGSVPVLEWLDGLPAKAKAKCLVRIRRLGQEGHALRRPEADYLRDDVYELRIDLGGIHYRVLYSFHGTAQAVLSHGLIKRRIVPPGEIDLAVVCRQAFAAHPQRHTHRE